ncbi:YugN family protein [Ferviditalea candida]|uniref:YugN family protein n=1 Tax=Ferviditalea candida TaxID=3108399 RepID=A0ABU5ZPK0_9BACL|nr:YugN family protein [Paenibacillaceae bacterium T2]
MIIENAAVKGLKSELAHLDKVAGNLGFVRWQWEYTRATYDYKMEDQANREDYYLRINCRAIEGKLEQPHAVLVLEDAYIGRATFPHGLDYESAIPDKILNESKQKITELKQQLG